MSYTSELKRQQAKALLNEAANEENQAIANAFEQARLTEQAEYQATRRSMEAAAEAERQAWKRFADGSLAVNGRIALVDDNVVTDRNSVRHWTAPTPLNKLGIPMCHTSGQPEKCLAPFNRAALDYPCEQCRWHPRNVKSDVWYE